MLSLTIVDSGPRFDPTELQEPDVLSPLEERAVGGLGVHLVKTFADRVTYEFYRRQEPVDAGARLHGRAARDATV